MTAPRLTDVEIAEWAERCSNPDAPNPEVLRLLAEVRRLRDVVAALPQCDKPYCGRPATRMAYGPEAYCDEHGKGASYDDVDYAEALRAYMEDR